MTRLFLWGLSILSCHVILTFMNFWQMKSASHLTLLGMKFSNVWTFWFAYTTLTLPVLFLTQYIFYWFYWYGYNHIFESRAWYVQTVAWASSIGINFFMIWMYFGELPTRNAVVACICLLGAFAAIVLR